MTTYTVTGGTGYIGSKLIEDLAQDDNNFIYAIIRSSSQVKVEKDNIQYVYYDGTESSLEHAIKESDKIFHLGALYTTGDDEDSLKNLIESNILFSNLLFNVVSRVNKNAVIATASTFSSLDGEGAYDPATLYAATKVSVEMIAHYYKDLSIHFLTFPDTYGSGDWRTKIHNLVIRNKNWPFEFRSSSTQQIMLLHIEDVIGHLKSAASQNEKGVHIHDIYSEGTLLTLKELSEELTDEECSFNESAENVAIPLVPREESTPTGWTTQHTKESIGKTLK